MAFQISLQMSGQGRTEFSQLPHPALTLLGTGRREMKACVHAETCTGTFLEVVFVTVLNWKRPDAYPLGKDERNVRHPHSASLSSVFRPRRHAAAWVNLRVVTVNGRSQTPVKEQST